MVKNKSTPRFVTSFSFPVTFKPVLDELKSIADNKGMSLSELVADILTSAVKDLKNELKELMEMEALDLVSQINEFMERIEKEDFDRPVMKKDIKQHAELLSEYILKLEKYEKTLNLKEIKQTLKKARNLINKLVDRYKSITPEEEEEARMEHLRKFVRRQILP